MAIFAMTNKDAAIIAPMAGNAASIIQSLSMLSNGDSEPSSDPSIQASLERAARVLSVAPFYAAREILIIFGSSLTNDSGNIQQSIQFLADTKTRASVVSLAPELHILRVSLISFGGTNSLRSSR